jgi:hypothetical protein
MSFLAPLFFLGLAGIALPIWLHRLSSENPNRQVFSSLMLLEPGEPRRVLAKNLQYLLLLALRVLLLVLLVLAFAGPQIWRAPAAAAEEDARLHLIVLDASGSMMHGERWSRAADAALDIIGELESEDLGQVVLAGRTAVVLTQETNDAALLRQAVTSAEPSVFQLDFGQMMRALDGVVRSATLPVVLHFVTDAQATSLPTRFAELAPRESAELAIHNVAEPGESNIAIETLGGSALTGALEASVRSFAETEVTRELTLTLNGEPVERRTVSIPPGTSVRVPFAALDLRAGSNSVSLIATPGDELAADDRRFIALQRPEPRSVLLVSGDLRGKDTLFFESAMGTLAALVLEPTRVGPDDLEDLDLSDFRFVVVTDAGVLGDEAAARLAAYVESGGRLFMALGPRSGALASVPVTEQVVQPSVILGRDEFAAVGAIDITHPALRGLEAVRAARFERYALVEPGRGDNVLIALDSGAPLLLERELGAGDVLVFTSTLDREWNDLAVQPVFVPLVSGLANHLLGGAGFSSEAALGSTLAVRAMGLAGGQIFDPQGEVALGLGGTGDVLLDQIGFYEVVGGGISQLVAVNFDAPESDLRPADVETLERWARLGTSPADARPGAAPEATEEDRVPTPIGLWILLIAFGALIMESWAGNWHLKVRRGIAA